ncbi:hypothetical protein ACFL6G_01145 [candidate division KSB1 bacterium]
MKVRIVYSLVMAVLILSCWTADSSAQAVATLMKELNKVDARLNDLESMKKDASVISKTDFDRIRNDLAELTTEIEKLKDQLSEAVTVKNSKDYDTVIAKLETQVSDLQKGVGEIASANGNGHSGDGESRVSENEDVAALTGAVQSLVEELRNSNGGSEESSKDTPGGGDTQELLGLGTESSLAPLEITGFADYYTIRGVERTEESSYQFGQVEVDLETNIDEKVVIGAAIAFDPGSETFGMGAFTVDFRLFGNEEGHFRTGSDVNTSGIMIGQFDVPFGLDWQVYPSIDRKLVTGPVAVENLHDYWNDYGFQAYIDTRYFNAVVYGTNGFGYDDVDLNLSMGGRFGFRPHESLEIGSSYASFMNENNKSDMSLLGFDAQFSYDAFSFKSEYITRKNGLLGGHTLTSTGYYAQGLYDFGKYFIVSRYGRFDPDKDGNDYFTRLSAGGGYVILDGCELRLEYQVNNMEDNRMYMQLAVGF